MSVPGIIPWQRAPRCSLSKIAPYATSVPGIVQRARRQIAPHCSRNLRGRIPQRDASSGLG
eukprot:3161791-Rhodomonas_salina.3